MSSRSFDKDRDRSYRIRERSFYRRCYDKDHDKNHRERSRLTRNDLDFNDLVSLSDRVIFFIIYIDNFLKDIVNERLNEAMQKRREKVERWRQQRRKLEDSNSLIINSSPNTMQTWSLDKDDDDEGEEKTNDKDNQITLNEIENNNQDNIADEEVDSLDAYMSEINKLSNPALKVIF